MASINELPILQELSTPILVFGQSGELYFANKSAEGILPGLPTSWAWPALKDSTPPGYVFHVHFEESTGEQLTVVECVPDFSALAPDSLERAVSFPPVVSSEAAEEEQEEQEEQVMTGDMEAIRRIAQTDAPVLLTGEVGVGKHRLARLLHSMSQRNRAPFTELNCAAISEDRIYDELLRIIGEGRPGADRNTSAGPMDAKHGTLFLSNLSELPLGAQAKLLAFLQSYPVLTVNGLTSAAVPIVRLVCSTHVDLATMVKAGTFRADLYFHLNVLPIHVPALRERLEEFPVLAQSIVNAVCQVHELSAKALTDDTVELLQGHWWPGNITELQAVLERACLLSEERVIEPTTLSEWAELTVKQQIEPQGDWRGVFLGEAAPLVADATGTSTPGTRTAQAGMPLKQQLEKLERDILQDAVTRCHSTYEIADFLHTSQATVVRRLQKFGLHITESK